MVNVQPFSDVLANALQAIENAPNRERLTLTHTRHSGILHGYYLAGATSVVEVTAAEAELRRVFEARLSQFMLQEAWRARHPSGRGEVDNA